MFFSLVKLLVLKMICGVEFDRFRVFLGICRLVVMVELKVWVLDFMICRLVLKF